MVEMMEKYTLDEFRTKFSEAELTKVLQLYGHEKIKHTAITKRCTYELGANCLSQTCANCSGIPCAEITLK